MRADGTDRGQSVQCRISRPVDEAKALSLVKKAISKIKNLAAELGDDELEELFTAADYHSRPGKLSQYRQNELTNERLFIMCGAVDEIMIDSKAAGAVMFEAAYTLAHSYPLAYYIQWPLVAAEFMTKDPFKPFFDLWHRKVAWRFTKGNSVEVYTPRSAR
jgi:hypothetical protein